jgi:F-type H+-transporting ATPase subunit b
MHLLSSVVLAGSIIDIDGTIFVHLLIFLLAFLLLRALVFKPMVALFEAREQAIDGARAEARQMERDAAKKVEAFEEEMRKVRLEAGAERDRLRNDGLRLERTILDKVQKETQATVAAADERMRADADRVRRDIHESVPRLARDMASKLLGREVS